jgi:hypothetical protein
MRVVVVGDSQGHSLAVNEPVGLDEVVDVSNGSLPGCSIYDAGAIVTARAGVRNNFGMCEGWQADWAAAASSAKAEVALVVLGAWDVFDLRLEDGTLLTFGTPAWDQHVATNLQSGINALAATGAKIALLEAPCMRPEDVEGAAVPALPERADDVRVGHVNELWRQLAMANADTTTFVRGPGEFCTDPKVAESLAMRWDGVHVYGPGAALIFEAVTDQLLALR